MKKLSLLILFSICSLLLSAQISCSLDNTFGINGRLVADQNRRGEHIIVQPDGKILVACNPEGNGPAYIQRYNADGSIDISYGNNGKCTIAVAEIVTRITGMTMYNNQLFVCGNTTTYIGGAATTTFAAGITSYGSLLNTFGINGVKPFPAVYKTCSGITADNSGNLYVCGSDYLTELFVAKLSANGNYDNSFDGDGITTLNTGTADHSYRTAGIKIDKNNKILVSGKLCRADASGIADFRKMMIIRFMQNGSTDNSFANAGIALFNSNVSNFDQAQDVHVLPGNDYILCGDTYDGIDYDYSVLKVKNDGTADAGFGSNGWQVHDLEMSNESDNPVNSALLPDGRILMSGRLNRTDTVYFSLLMMNADGTRDASFGPGGIFKNVFISNNNNWSRGLGMDASGKIVLAGHTQSCVNNLCGPYKMAISKYNSSFAPTKVAETLQKHISMYPNPVNRGDAVFINNQSGTRILNVHITNVSGQTQFVQIPQEASFSIPMGFPSGFYFCTLETGAGLVTVKVMIQ